MLAAGDSKIRALFTRWTEPPGSAGKNEVRYWQDKLLFSLLLAGLVFGLPVYAASVALCIKEGLWVVAAADTLIYGWVAVLFFRKQLPFALRAYSIVYIGYVLGMVLLLTVGPFGAGPVWLFAFPVLAAVFMGIRTSLMALTINACSIVFVGMLFGYEVLTWTIPIQNAIEKWAVMALNFLLLNGIVAISAAYISRGLMISLEQEKETRESLERNHAELMDFTRQLEQEIIERKKAEADRRHQEEERRKLETQLRQAQKMEAIGTLAGGIAHDFNNILSSVIGYSELAMDEAERGSLLEDSLLEILTAGNRAKDLVSQILTFARRADENAIPTQIGSIARESLKMLRSAIPTTIDIQDDIRSDSRVMADPTQIHQVFMNLCTNAAQAMEDSGGILTVQLCDEKIQPDILEKTKGMTPGNYLKIQISDTGKGIPEKDLGAVFDPYFTTKPVGEGTGLGLSVVHGIVEGYNGSITIASEVGKGTAFIIYLPISEKETSLDQADFEELPMGDERILFVDDESSIVKMGSRLLEGIGYAVTGTNNAEKALSLFKSNPEDFDLVITDTTMPNMAGDRLAAEIMKIRPDIPVILCTGYSKKLSEETIQEMGVRALIMKPFNQRHLAETVRKILDEAKNKFTHYSPNLDR